MSKDVLFLVFFFFLSMLTSCAGIKKNSLKKELVRTEEGFNYSDKNGSFLVLTSSGFNKKDNTFFTKRSLEILNKDDDKMLEQSIALSNIGMLKKRTILRPKISQYSVWFEGKKYSSELKLNTTAKAIDVKMISPEAQWNGVKQIKLPSSKSIYCFFSQVIECAKTIGFIDEATKKEAGTMNFYVVWEGYPYLNETFSDFPSEVFSRAQLEYDGKTKEEERRFNLKVVGQSIFYVIDKNEQMEKMFWVSQGISMVSKKLKNSAEDKSVTGESFE